MMPFAFKCTSCGHSDDNHYTGRGPDGTADTGTFQCHMIVLDRETKTTLLCGCRRATK